MTSASQFPPINPLYPPSQPTSAPARKSKTTPPKALKDQTNTPSPTKPLSPGRFKQWRTDEPPDLSYAAILIDIAPLQGLDSAIKKQVLDRCLEDYEKANKSLEQAIGDTALRYIYPNGDPKKAQGKQTVAPLLQVSQKLSERYLDLMRAYVRYENAKGLPMISNAAGQMKNHGFETQEILKMYGSCKELMNILESIKSQLLSDSQFRSRKVLNTEGQKLYDAAKDVLFSKEKRAAFGSNSTFEQYPQFKSTLASAISSYEALPEHSLIDRAFFMMWNFPQMSHDEIEMQLYEVANLKAYANVSDDSRLLMEIRHRIGGEGSSQQMNPGSVGQNPLAYLNIIKKGEPDNPEGQFREQMYFVYMLNNFANTVMQNPELVDFTNKMLEEGGKNWQIDKTFVHDMNQRGAKYLPPVFRYGAQAALNSFIRSKSSEEEKKAFNQKVKIPTLQELIEYNETFRSKKTAIKVTKKVTISHDTSFRHQLTQRELLNQFGDLNVKSVDTNQPLKVHAGGAGFRLPSSQELKPPATKDPKFEDAKEYIEIIERLKIPVAAGISGTLDQTMTMAGLVGIGLDEDKEKDQEQIKLALLAFMIPNTDHSVHEILQSSKTFGLQYLPGPGFERYIYPSGGAHFLELLRQEQAKRGQNMPSYYLSEEHIRHVIKEII